MKPNSSYRVDFDAIKRMPFERIAAAWGYVRDAEASTRASPVLRAPGQPKLVARLRENGHWVYFSTLDADDSGTAIDFMLGRGLSFADIRARFGKPVADARDFRSLWREAAPDPAPEWLVGRGIRKETLEFYRPLIRCDRNGRVLFAHRDRRRALTGFEIGPPEGARRFATGGTRSLFALRAGTAEDLQALVVAEGAVNALSLAQIDQCPASRAFLSTAGAPSPRQCEQIGLAARLLPGLRTVILAQDNDEAGERQAETLRERAQIPARVAIQRRRPPENADWNDIVRAAPADKRAREAQD